MDVRRACEERGWRLLNAVPALECDEAEYEAHCEENDRIIADMAEVGGTWEIERYFIDPAHEPLARRRVTATSREIGDVLESADLKNGVDYAVSEQGTYLVIIANGQGYAMGGRHDFVTAVFECRHRMPQ